MCRTAGAEQFYVRTLGFDLMQRYGRRRFRPAGGYHHHIGLNTWAELARRLLSEAIGSSISRCACPPRCAGGRERLSYNTQLNAGVRCHGRGSVGDNARSVLVDRLMSTPRQSYRHCLAWVGCGRCPHCGEGSRSRAEHPASCSVCGLV